MGKAVFFPLFSPYITKFKKERLLGEYQILAYISSHVLKISAISRMRTRETTDIFNTFD